MFTFLLYALRPFPDILMVGILFLLIFSGFAGQHDYRAPHIVILYILSGFGTWY